MKNNIKSSVLRKDLTSFIAKTFQTVDPASEYIHNWHIDLIADRLEKVANGNIKRLIINVPPRSLKSVSVSVSWPAWILGNDPSKKIMVASYSHKLSLKHSLDCRMVIESPWYQELFDDAKIALGENEKHKFVTTNRGFRLATSIAGTTTGEGGDILIVDDPHNPTQANSDVQRQKAIDWFSQTFMSRLNDKKKGAVVLVMQRLHVDDLTGHLLADKSNKWNHLCLPAVFPDKRSFSYMGKRKNVQKGTFLNKNREGEGEIKRVKQELGNYAFSAQYLQNPIMLVGGMVEICWFGRYKIAPSEGEIIQSWDTATKSGKNNDYSVCTTWKITDKGYYLLEVIARKMEYPELKRRVLSAAKKWQADIILIEDKASGQSLLQDLRRESLYNFLAISPTFDKVTRFAQTTATIEAGNVHLPEYSAWLNDYEMQVLSFPNSSHDDMVDSTSHFLNWIKDRNNKKIRVRCF